MDGARGMGMRAQEEPLRRHLAEPCARDRAVAIGHSSSGEDERGGLPFAVASTSCVEAQTSIGAGKASGRACETPSYLWNGPLVSFDDWLVEFGDVIETYHGDSTPARSTCGATVDSPAVGNAARGITCAKVHDLTFAFIIS